MKNKSAELTDSLGQVDKVRVSRLKDLDEEGYLELREVLVGEL